MSSILEAKIEQRIEELERMKKEYVDNGDRATERSWRTRRERFVLDELKELMK